MTKVLFPNGLLAVDDNGNPIQSATLTPYLLSDSAQSNPLTVYDPTGATPITLKSNSKGVLPDFTVDVPDANDTEPLQFVSGDQKTTVWSPYALKTIAEAAKESAADSADAAQASAADAKAAKDQMAATTGQAIDTYLGGDAEGLVNTVAAKADLDPDTGKVKASQLPDTASPPTATNATYGTIKLAGDLAGPASAPVVPGLASKATDTAVVHKTGSETVAGVKTFTSAPVVPDGAFTIAKVSGLQDALDNAGGGGSSVVIDTTDYTTVL